MSSCAHVYAARRESRPTTDLAPSNKSKGVVNVTSPHFRISLDKRNIYISDKDPPTWLLMRATKIISEPHKSSEMDDVTALALRQIVKSLATKNEAAIISQLGIPLFPAMTLVPDPRLALARKELWDFTIPIPLDPLQSKIQPQLPRPKPYLVFGYSKEAFDQNQRSAIDLLSNELNQNYAMPVKTLCFPFLLIEFKAFSTGGNPFSAENQAANAGAIAMNGLLELNKRISVEPILDSDCPQFFSVTMNNKFVSVNVHWSSKKASNGSTCYHMATLTDYILTESDGLKAVHQIVKNILEYAVSERLPMICEALDTYKQNSVGKREKAVHGRESASESQKEAQQVASRQSDATVYSTADRQPAKRRKLGHPAQGDMGDDSLDDLAKELPSGRATKTRTMSAEEKQRPNAPSGLLARPSSRIAKLGHKG